MARSGRTRPFRGRKYRKARASASAYKQRMRSYADRIPEMPSYAKRVHCFSCNEPFYFAGKNNTCARRSRGLRRNRNRWVCTDIACEKSPRFNKPLLNSLPPIDSCITSITNNGWAFFNVLFNRGVKSALTKSHTSSMPNMIEYNGRIGQRLDSVWTWPLKVRQAVFSDYTREICRSFFKVRDDHDLRLAEVAWVHSTPGAMTQTFHHYCCEAIGAGRVLVH